ncbi:MAG: hypothetical protein AAGA61_10540 [Pseudomonadota bacterium]
MHLKALIRLPIIAIYMLSLSACDGEIYLRDGVTDGDVFTLQSVATISDDPATQSWIRYSLTRSVCQLEADVPNPARADSYRCEIAARRQLVDAWRSYTQNDERLDDKYLDVLLTVDTQGFLREYVAHHFARRTWTVPTDLNMAGYHAWRRESLRGHRPVTRIVGSWSFRPNAETVKSVR